MSRRRTPHCASAPPSSSVPSSILTNGYSGLAEWRNDWRNTRSAQFTLAGNSSKEGGNQFARLRRNRSRSGRYRQPLVASLP